MKKFFHAERADVEALEAFLLKDWQLFLCTVDGSACRRVDCSAVRTYFDATLRLLGRYPEDYLLATRNFAPESTSLSAIMGDLEHGGPGDVFALVGYNDGGLISLSRANLSLQREARPAAWWSGKFAS